MFNDDHLYEMLLRNNEQYLLTYQNKVPHDFQGQILYY